MTRCSAILPVCLLLALAGCSRSLHTRLEGKWRHATGRMTVEFLKDGSFTGSAGPLPISGSYATPDERHVRIEGSGLIGGLLGPQVYEAREGQGRLELSAGTNRQEFQRVQP